MWSPITHTPPPLSANFVSPSPKWLDSDDDFEHEPALISDDALSSGCSRAPSLAPLDSEDLHIDIVSSPIQDTSFRGFPSSRAAPLSRYRPPNHAKSSATREDVAAALLALHAQPRLSSSHPALPNIWTQLAAETQHHPFARRPRDGEVSPSLRNLILPRTPSPPPRAPLSMTPIIDSDLGHKTPPSVAHIAPSPLRLTPAFSPLPPSSPLAEEDDSEGSVPPRFHSLSFKPELLRVHIPADNSGTDESASVSRDRDAKEDNNDSHLITHKPISATSPPSLEKQQRRIQAPPLSPPPSLSSSLPRAASTKRPSPEEADDHDVDTDANIVEPVSTSTSTSAPPAHTRSKRRRRNAKADDKPWRDRKKHASAPTTPPRDSPSTSTSTTPPTPPSASDTQEPCPHPALLGLLLETLTLSRASSLTQNALVRTNPALAPSSSAESSAVLATTLKWAVQARVLGCVRSSGEALPPSYFYDPTMDPDRERGELLRYLMPRAGKRRETMKYKQYYWAPVVVGRGRTRTWDVDWED